MGNSRSSFPGQRQSPGGEGPNSHQHGYPGHGPSTTAHIPPPMPYPPRAPQQQAICPRCQCHLLVPPGAALFRCPCGVVLRSQAPPPPAMSPPGVVTSGRRGRAEGRAVMCRRCGNLAIVPVMGRSIVFCSCGAPIINDLLMSLLSEGGDYGDMGGMPMRRPRPEGDGASRDLIEMLPTCKYTSASAPPKQLLDVDKVGPAECEHDDLSCRVCFEEYSEGDDLRVLPCFHKFHKSCIDEWLGRKKLCPLCNTSVDIILQDSSQLT